MTRGLFFPDTNLFVALMQQTLQRRGVPRVQVEKILGKFFIEFFAARVESDGVKFFRREFFAAIFFCKEFFAL